MLETEFIYCVIVVVATDCEPAFVETWTAPNGWDEPVPVFYKSLDTLDDLVLMERQTLMLERYCLYYCFNNIYNHNKYYKIVQIIKQALYSEMYSITVKL